MILSTLTVKPLLITVGVLSALLLASGAWNVSQFRAAAIAKVAHNAEIQALRDEARIAGLLTSNRQSSEIAAEAEQQRERLAAQFDAIAQEQRRLNASYAGALARLPPLPANCGPGQARVDAFNRSQ